MKKILVLLCLCLAGFGFGMEYNGCFDDANLLKPETVTAIREVGKRLYDNGKVEFTVKIVKDCNDTLLDGREFFNTTGIGDKEKNNGLLLFVNAKNFKINKLNKIRFLVGYGLEGMFTDSKCGRILDLGLSKSGIDEKILEIVNQVDSEFKSLGDSPIPSREKGKLDKIIGSIGLVLIILFLIVVVIFIFSTDVGGNEIGGSYGGGDGGFSGGGFSGGFGGGSCGGGGAGR